MEHFNGIKLAFKGQARTNYMSLPDMVQDLTTNCLISIVPTLKKLNDQLSVMREIEQRNELEDSVYFELLENCNGL